MAYEVIQNFSGKDVSTIGTGGPLAKVVATRSADELLGALEDYPDAICIGGGSNLLVSDEGLSEVIIRAFGPAAGHVEISGVDVTAEATASWDEFVGICVDAGLAGLESTSGIPGTVGGALVQNAGAYGQEIGEVVTSVDAFDRETRKLVTFNDTECDFAYRHSCFKHDNARRYVIIRVHLRLEKSTTAQPRYGDVSVLLNSRFGHSGPYPLADIRAAIIEVRKSKGMIIGASLPSAGSFFTNPMLNDDQVAKLEAADIPIIVRSDGQRSASAAQLISAAGFSRGQSFGNAGLSEFHVLAIVNRDNAKTGELLALARQIREAVANKFGVVLTPEPVMLGSIPSI